MIDLIEQVWEFIESKTVLSALSNNNHKCEIIHKNNLIIILCPNLRITFMNDSFIFISIKLKHKLSKKKLAIICKGFCSRVNYSPCLYNRKEIIHYIELINIRDKEDQLIGIIKLLINLL